MKNLLSYSLLVVAISLSSTCAYSDNNSFFGTTAGAANAQSSDMSEDSNPNAVLPGLNDTMPSNNAMGTDFTGDEKRMQKKYKANLNKAKELIEKGEEMMESAKTHNDATYKKGKIFKETGEKWLAELKANNPFPGQKTK